MKHTNKNQDLLSSFDMSPFSKDLDYFIVCAEEKNILKASQKLDIQQSGLSKMILRLEQDLGEKLFSRNSHGVQLTHFGENLFKSLKQTQKYWEDLSSREIKKKLSIGAHSAIANTYFPVLLPKLIEHVPEIILHTEFDASLNITQKVADLKLDMGIVINPVKNSDLVAHTISTSSTSLYAKNKTNSKILYYNPEMFTNQRMIKRFSGYKKIPMEDYEVIANVVKQSDALGLLPNTVANRHNLINISESLLTVNLCLIWHRDQNKSEIIRFASELLKKTKLG